MGKINMSEYGLINQYSASAQENEYAVGDRKSMEAGGGKYLNFIAIVLKKK